MKRSLALALMTLTAATRLAAACPSCYTSDAGPAPSHWPIVAATAFMLVLPIGLVGGFFWWLQRADRLERSQTPSSRNRLEEK